MKTTEIEFIETCNCCPEAYKIMYKGEEIGYMKLRWGYLSLTGGKYVSIFAKDRSETIDVWGYQFENDLYKGEFDDDKEREHFKKLATDKLIKFYSSTHQRP